jgi:hypothetical protein
VIVVISCIVLVAIGLLMVVRWGALPSPAMVNSGSTAASWRPWLVRSAAVAAASGLLAGLLAAGAGGRLVMRLLAVTSTESLGQLTEAEQTIGRISFEGTLGFLIFVGLPFGLVSGLLYMAVGRLLPGRWIRGCLFGLLLLLLGSTRTEPLRSDNFDFNLVGPAWLAVGSFVALVLFHGMLVVALHRRLSLAWLPSEAPPLPERWRSRALTGGRLAVAAVALLALPGFLVAVTDIL